MNTVTGALGSNIGNSNVSYGTVALLVVVVVITLFVFNGVLRLVEKVA